MDIFQFSFDTGSDHYAPQLDLLLKQHFPGGLPGEMDGYGIYLATATAGIEESVAFWRNTLEKTPAFVNPANFPYTLSNAPASCIAKSLGVKGPVYTLVGKTNAVSGCMLNASADLSGGVVQNALVIGFDRTETRVELSGILLREDEVKCLEHFFSMPARIPDQNPSVAMRLVLKEANVAL